MHQIERDYVPRNWKVYLIRLSESDQKPPFSRLDDNGASVKPDSVWFSGTAKWVVCNTESEFFRVACEFKDKNPSWDPQFLLYDYEILAAEVVTDNKHYAPLDLGFLTKEWHGHRPGALVMSLPTHLGSEVTQDEYGFTWMVEVIE